MPENTSLAPEWVDDKTINEVLFCREFLEDLSPEHALISCGRNNDYGHPHAVVLERLEAVGARIWRTDEQGSIVVRIREGQITVETEYDS